MRLELTRKGLFKLKKVNVKKESECLIEESEIY